MNKESQMANTAIPVSTNGHAAAADAVELRHIPLSSIVVTDGFNPRGEVIEDDDLKAMAETMREHGCLQPIRVQATVEGKYRLVAGERRFRAAALAALTEVPASIKPIGVGSEEEELDLLVEAMIENELRSDLNPLQRAQAYQAMIDGGLSVRGVAERLAGKTKRGTRERRIREQLQILALPDDLTALIAREQIPLLAVRCLVELAAIHEHFARVVVNLVLSPPDGYEPYTWAEITESPLETAVQHCEEMPAGLFLSGSAHPVEQFSLSEKAQRNRAAYEKLTSGRIGAVRFTPELVEQAGALNAAYDCGWQSIIVGKDVADRLAADYIAKVLKERRAYDRLMQQRGTQAAGSEGTPKASEVAGDVGDAETPEEQAESAKADAAAKREQREQAIKFNLDLGLLAFKYLAKLKVDERVLRVLASVNFGDPLSRIATRGARYGLPGWVTQTERNGRTKTAYLETHEAHSKAREFLAGARSAGDIAGRTFTLIALAVLADENAIAASSQSYYTLRFEGPWAAQAERDLHTIVRERINEGLHPALDDLLTERIAADEQAAQVEEANHDASLRLDDRAERLTELSDSELDETLADAELVWGRYELRTHHVKNEIKRRATNDSDPATAPDLAAAA
jgi:ParB/RepB/Spo0J family partition protein